MDFKMKKIQPLIILFVLFAFTNKAFGQAKKMPFMLFYFQELLEVMDVQLNLQF